MTSDAQQKRGNLRYAITYNVVLANQMTESFDCRYVNYLSIGRH